VGKEIKKFAKFDFFTIKHLRIWFVVRGSWIVVCALKNEIWQDSSIASRQGAKAPRHELQSEIRNTNIEIRDKYKSPKYKIQSEKLATEDTKNLYFLTADFAD